MLRDDEAIAAAMGEITRNLGEMVSTAVELIDEFPDATVERSEISTGDNDQDDRASHHHDYHDILLH